MSWLARPERAKKPVRLPFLLNGLWPGSPGDTLPEFRQAVKFSTLYQEIITVPRVRSLRISNETLTFF
jgi:hypothetical protein